MDLILNAFVYAICTIIACGVLFFLYAFCLAFYKVYFKKEGPRKSIQRELSIDDVNNLRDNFLKNPEQVMQVISRLPEDQQALLLQYIKQDERNWIQLHVEKNGSMLYFYDGEDANAKFLFQCKTYEEMVDNLQKIRGIRGVRISQELVKKLEMEDFFIKPEVYAQKKDTDESI